jgi:hypothetical protein
MIQDLDYFKNNNLRSIQYIIKVNIQLRNFLKDNTMLMELFKNNIPCL